MKRVVCLLLSLILLLGLLPTALAADGEETGGGSPSMTIWSSSPLRSMA